MKIPGSGFRAAWSRLLPLLAVGVLFSCQSESSGDRSSQRGEDSPSAEERASTTRSEVLSLRVALLSPALGLDEGLREWGEVHGAKVLADVVEDPLGAGVEYALVEVEASDLGDLVQSRRLRPLSGLRTESEALAANETGLFEAQLYGMAWRGALHGVALPAPIESGPDLQSWSALARLGQRLSGVALWQDDRGVEAWAFLALSVGSGMRFFDAQRGTLRLDGDEAVEALSFLARLHGRAPRIDSTEELDSHLLAGGVSSAPSNYGGTWMGWPRPQGGRPVAWVEARLLCEPRQAPYAELAESLVRWLVSAEAAARLGEGATEPWVSLRRDTLSEVDALALPALVGERRALELWSGAVTAVMDRRRSAEAALEEAQDQWAMEQRGP